MEQPKYDQIWPYGPGHMTKMVDMPMLGKGSSDIGSWYAGPKKFDLVMITCWAW